MALAWPPSLPQSPRLGWSEKAGKNVVRTQVSSGPAKLRRRFTGAVRELTWPTLFTDAQADTFWTFYQTTTADGSLKFTLIHPRTSATVEVRFLGQPQINEFSPGLWKATIQLEIIDQLDLP